MTIFFAPALLHDLLDSPAIDDAHAAVVDGSRTYSHGELRQRVEQLARALRAEGVVRGDRVALWLPKSFDECAGLLAASRVDAVVVPINPVLRPRQAFHILADCEARLLLTLSEQRTALDELLPGLPGLRVVCLDEMDAIPAGEALPRALAISADLAAILYTSGSTGSPKGVMLTHANLLAGTRIVRSYLGITASDRILSVLPFSFDYGLNQWLTVVEQGATIVLLNFQMGDQIVRQLAQQRITALAGVPALWAILTRAAPSMLKTPLPHLRYITNSGGAVPEATVRKLRQLLPQTQIFLMYGLTEAFRSTYLPPDEVDRRPTSIGRAIPESEVLLITADGRQAMPGEPGILVHRGPTVSMGYWRRPEDTARVLRPNPLRSAAEGAERVCWSGDLAVADEEGFIYFVGREDAMIKSAGYRISPSEVEDALMSTGAFRQVAVVGLPDEWVGQRICAVGVAMPSADGKLPEASGVLQALAPVLPSHMLPARIDWVDNLPLSPNGKVDYKTLQAQRLS